MMIASQPTQLNTEESEFMYQTTPQWTAINGPGQEWNVEDEVPEDEVMGAEQDIPSQQQPSTQQGTSATTSRASFPCPTCGKVIVARWRLNEEMNLHTGARPFACIHAGCSKVYPTRGGAYSHVRSIHEGGQHICSVCLTPFIQRGDLGKHIERDHRGV